MPPYRWNFRKTVLKIHTETIAPDVGPNTDGCIQLRATKPQIFFFFAKTIIMLRFVKELILFYRTTEHRTIFIFDMNILLSSNNRRETKTIID